MDTIFALSSARGKAGVAVIRISGPKSPTAAIELAGVLPPPRQSTLRRLHSPEWGHLDTSLILYFPKGASYTGEDSVEFHVHGGVATVKSVLAALGSLEGLRMAEAGEFTLQALMNGRLNLSEIEGLGDLIDAETDAQRRQALRLFRGELGQRVEEWRQSLTQCAAILEASLDFSDEDLPHDLMSSTHDRIEDLIQSLEKEIQGVQAAERIRDGFEVAIVGAPNTGKSTLLNCLAGREAALTSERSGTTRDVIEVRMEIAGLAVTLLDLAGIRDAIDPIEKMGVNKARQRAKEADLRVFLVEGDGVPDNSPEFLTGDLILKCKADLYRPPPPNGISGLTGFGVDHLTQSLADELEKRSGIAMTAAHARHRAAIEGGIGHLKIARDSMMKVNRIELAAEEIWLSINQLETLIGNVDIEHVLDEVFAGFCIGK